MKPCPTFIIPLPSELSVIPTREPAQPKNFTWLTMNQGRSSWLLEGWLIWMQSPDTHVGVTFCLAMASWFKITDNSSLHPKFEGKGNSNSKHHILLTWGVTFHSFPIPGPPHSACQYRKPGVSMIFILISYVLLSKIMLAKAGDMWDTSSIPGSGRSSGGGHGNHSSIPAWRIPWTEESGGPQSIGLQKSRTELNQLSTHVHMFTKIIVGIISWYM